MAQSKATPGPWGIERGRATLWIGPMRPDGIKVASIVVWLPYGPDYTAEHNERQVANAEFIISAVNSYDEMLAVLKECLGLANIAETLTGCRSDDDYVDGIKAQIEAAIYRAEAANTKKGLRE